MATAYSTLLGLALPVQGELSGTWGDMVDNGITRYVDIAVAGTVTLTNDGAVSLSLTNGDSSQTNIVSSLTGAGTVSAQFAIIKVTGTLTTAKILTPPSSSRTYVVVNAATGSTVTVKASGQTGVSIAVGETAFVYFNGTDYVKVAGTVNTGVTSFQTSLSGLTPSTSTTGAVTLAGTLGTSSGGTNLTSFTSGGVVYASSSSVLATGSALYFDGTKLGINTSSPVRTLSIANGGPVVEIDPAGGTAGPIYFNYNRSTATYLTPEYWALAHIWNVSGGTEAMRLTSTGLGIGTSSQSAKLGVVTASTATNQLRITSSDSTAQLRTYTTSDGDGLIINHYYAVSGSPYLRSADFVSNINDVASTMMRFFTKPFSANPVEALRIDSSGNLGLGVTPSAWNSAAKALQLSYGALYSFSSFTFLSNNNYINASGQYIYSNNGQAADYYQYLGTHAWRTAASGTAGNTISFTTAMLLNASGNLIIGDTTGNGKLSVRDSSAALQEIYTTAGTSYAALEVKNTGGSFYIGRDNSAGSFFGSTSSYTSCLYSSGAYPMAFMTNGTERTRISAAGGFSVGTTADPGAGAIYATGNITAYYSDARLKTVSGKIENALDKVAQLSGVYYTNNDTAKSFGYDSDEVQVGVLAQDVEAVLPQIVKAAPFDLDQDGNSKSGENYKTVQYERLVPLLIEAINELQAKVKALESK